LTQIYKMISESI